MVIGIMVLVILFLMAEVVDTLHRIEKRLKAEFKQISMI